MSAVLDALPAGLDVNARQPGKAINGKRIRVPPRVTLGEMSVASARANRFRSSCRRLERFRGVFALHGRLNHIPYMLCRTPNNIGTVKKLNMVSLIGACHVILVVIRILSRSACSLLHILSNSVSRRGQPTRQHCSEHRSVSVRPRRSQRVAHSGTVFEPRVLPRRACRQRHLSHRVGICTGSCHDQRRGPNEQDWVGPCKETAVWSGKTLRDDPWRTLVSASSRCASPIQSGR